VSLQIVWNIYGRFNRHLSILLLSFSQSDPFASIDFEMACPDIRLRPFFSETCVPSAPISFANPPSAGYPTPPLSMLAFSDHKMCINLSLNNEIVPRIRLRVMRVQDLLDAAYVCKHEKAVTNERSMYLSSFRNYAHRLTTTPCRRELLGMYSSSVPEEQHELESSP